MGRYRSGGHCLDEGLRPASSRGSPIPEGISDKIKKELLKPEVSKPKVPENELEEEEEERKEAPKRGRPRSSVVCH